jgi:hypothetical protein
MKCCASPTTSTAPDARAVEAARVARAFTNALLFREILKPLASALGPVGETALGSVVDRLFARPPQ